MCGVSTCARSGRGGGAEGVTRTHSVLSVRLASAGSSDLCPACVPHGGAGAEVTEAS